MHLMIKTETESLTLIMSRSKVVIVIPEDDYRLLIKFSNGELRRYDMKKNLFGVFEILKDINKFKEVFIDEYGNIAWNREKNIDSNICWNNRIDLCNDAIYLDSERVTVTWEK